ncbi:MAG: 30S ribosomal protein S3 [Candidatus Marinimicrobia bacterium]|nr:30S ribosomal protein S3 [Candidatus Neomarinimicrobiota bacterium]
MGQKVNPIGLRVSVTKNWRSRWYAGKRQFGDLLHEDLLIRNRVQERLKDGALADIIIERYANRARVTLHTARPGIVVGRRGADLERLREELGRLTGKDVYLDVVEVKNPDTQAQLIAEQIAVQLERRVSFRRALKRAVQMAMELGCLGVRVRASGRLGGSELARTEGYREGKVPLHTLRANVEYGFAEAKTMAGLIGVKVWTCKEPEAVEATNPREKTYAAYA